MRQPFFVCFWSIFWHSTAHFTIIFSSVHHIAWTSGTQVLRPSSSSRYWCLVFLAPNSPLIPSTKFIDWPAENKHVALSLLLTPAAMDHDEGHQTSKRLSIFLGYPVGRCTQSATVKRVQSFDWMHWHYWIPVDWIFGTNVANAPMFYVCILLCLD